MKGWLLKMLRLLVSLGALPLLFACLSGCGSEDKNNPKLGGKLDSRMEKVSAPTEGKKPNPE
jgi:hypothetical protein